MVYNGTNDYYISGGYIMSDKTVKFMEFVSKNEEARKELEAACAGIDKADKKALTEAAVKFAAKHGFTLTAEDFAPKMEEMSEAEMKAVAGGKCTNDTQLIYCGSPNWWCGWLA